MHGLGGGLLNEVHLMANSDCVEGFHDPHRWTGQEQMGQLDPLMVGTLKVNSIRAQKTRVWKMAMLQNLQNLDELMIQGTLLHSERDCEKAKVS